MKHIIYKIPQDGKELIKLKAVVTDFVGHPGYYIQNWGYLVFYMDKRPKVGHQAYPTATKEDSISEVDLSDKSFSFLQTELNMMKKQAQIVDKFPAEGVVQVRDLYEKTLVVNTLKDKEYRQVQDIVSMYPHYIEWYDAKFGCFQRKTSHLEFTLPVLFLGFDPYPGDKDTFPKEGWMRFSGAWEARQFQNMLFSKGYIWSNSKYGNNVPKQGFRDTEFIFWKTHEPTKLCIQKDMINMTSGVEGVKEYKFIDFYDDGIRDSPINNKIKNHETNELQRQTKSIKGRKGSTPIRPYSGVCKVTSSERLVGNKIGAPKVKTAVVKTSREPRILSSGYSVEKTRDYRYGIYDSCS